MYVPYQREKSRERSRDHERKHHGRSPSEDDELRKHRPSQFRESRSRGKRVKFEENGDVRVFKKEDEPSAKGLSEEQITALKVELQKEIAKNYDFNWQHFKHRDALSQSNSMREQREKERVLNEKLMGARQLIGYVCPVWLKKDEKSLAEWGVDSLQRQAHTNRIHDILGCYYTHLSEIPNQPTFQILNTNTTSESKTIKFDHDTPAPDPNYNSTRKLNDQKALKGILKMPLSPAEKPPLEPKNISPQLILLLSDIKKNPSAYSKEQTEQALKPYRESGELEYLTKNKDVLEMMLRNMAVQVPQTVQPVAQPYIPRSSAGRESNERPSQPQNYAPMGYPHSFVPKADKYRTVPCKYFHSHLGCNKVDNCTYIHDERYKGVAVPPNYSPPTQVKMPSYPQPIHNAYKGYPPLGPSTVPPGQPQGFSGSMPPPYSNPGYYSGTDRPGGYPGPVNSNPGNYSNSAPRQYPPRNDKTYPGSYAGGNPGNYQGGNPSNYQGGNPGNYPIANSSYPSAQRNYPGGRNSEGRGGYPNSSGTGPYPGQNPGSYPPGGPNSSVGGGYGNYPPGYYNNSYGNPQGYGYYGQQQGQNSNNKNN